jgi:MoaA/NifB/PqqE/SkfB family radical SAM enzyme
MRPILLHYYITNRCNSRCVFCDIWQEQPKVDACEADVGRNLNDARQAGCRFVDFTGGEPLLHPLLPRFLSLARDQGFITSVTTNCLLFEKRAAELAGLIDLPHFSLDADSAQLHDQLRGVASYAAVMRSIPVALAHKLAPDLLFTYSNDTIDAFEGVFRLARAYRLMVILDPLFSLDGREAVSPATHAKARAYARRAGVYLNTAHLALRRAGGNRIDAARCRAASSTIVILPDNRLALPCFHHDTYPVGIGDSLSAALGQGCHINCYFDPSYLYRPDLLLASSLWSKWRYSWRKYVIYGHPRPGGRPRRHERAEYA